jgi:signal transduction histidine kinase
LGADTILVAYGWRRALGLARAGLGLWSVAELFLAPQTPPVLQSVLHGLFAVYAILALFWNAPEQPRFALLRLVLDTIFFLIHSSDELLPGAWLSALFFAYLMVSATMLQGWRKVLVVAGLCATFHILTRPADHELLLPALAAAGVVGSVLAYHRGALAGRLSSFSRQVVLYRSDAEAARDAERKRIALDFHDGPLQSFISFQMRLEIVKKMLQRDQAAGLEELRQLQELCQNQVADLRSFIRSMRPVEVEGASLGGSIRRMVEDFRKDTGISAGLTGGETLGTPDPAVSLEVLQIVREALNNVQKHSKASRVNVGLAKADKSLEISVEDDGTGFPFSGAYNLDELDMLRLGPVSIKRRVRGLEGDLVLESRPGHGSGIKIRIPV